MLSRCTAVASPIALCPQSSRPIVAYVADIIAMGKKYVSIIKQTLYLQSKQKLFILRECTLTVKYTIAQ